MRKHYLDNIRWITVVTVVIFHVIYMYNAEGIVGVVGKITNLETQYYDAYQYIVYPWFMSILFMVSGISSRIYLESHTDKEFIKSRTVKLLVPCTIGLCTFQFLQGYVNVSLSNVFEKNPGIPLIGKIFAVLASGIGVLWYIQMLWLFSLFLVLIRKIEKDRLRALGKKAGLPAIILLAVPFFLSAQILNAPIVVYHFGLYTFAFLLGYFVLSNDEVIEILKKYFLLFAPIALLLGVIVCLEYFGQNYADKPVNRTIEYVMYDYSACLTIIGGMAKYCDFSNSFTKWMSDHSWGLYVFHYLGISSVGLFLARPGYVSAPAAYLLSTVAGFGGAYLLNAVISRIPGYRWTVLGISSGGSSYASSARGKNRDQNRQDG